MQIAVELRQACSRTLFQNPQQVCLCRPPRIRVHQSLDGKGLFGKAGKLLALDADVAQALRNVDGAANPLDGGNRPLGGGFFAQAADVLARAAPRSLANAAFRSGRL